MTTPWEFPSASHDPGPFPWNSPELPFRATPLEFPRAPHDPKSIQLGIARLLCKIDKQNRILLKPHGFLTRDARIKERKKYGLRKARKAPQYSKR